MSSREEMLERVRSALGRSQADPATPEANRSPLRPARLEGVMPAIPLGELVAKFESELAKLSGSVHRAANTAELETVLRQVLGAARRVVLTRNPLLSELGLAERLAAWGIAVSQWPAGAPAASATSADGRPEASYRQASFDADAGITGVDFVLAETGSLVLTSRTEGAQLASLAPPVHVALYRERQVLASLDDVLESLKDAGGPVGSDSGRSVVFVTGTSRTADIEQILIRGVHGPREVHAILVADACLSR